MSRAKPTTDDDFDDFEAFDKDFDVDADLLSSAGEHARSRKQAAWQRLEQRKDVRRLREELEDWEDWDNLDSL